MLVKDDNYWMAEAIKLAKLAALNNEVPVGAVVTLNGEVIGSGFNGCIQDSDPSAHAEIVALRKAAQYSKNYRLLGTTLYVTLEPCAMCLGAMLHARIKRLVFAARDPKTGVVGGKINLLSYSWNHKIEYTEGILAAECSSLLQNFFKGRR